MKRFQYLKHFDERTRGDAIIIRFGEIGDTIATIPVLVHIGLMGYDQTFYAYEQSKNEKFDASHVGFLLRKFACLVPVKSRYVFLNPFFYRRITKHRNTKLIFLPQVDGGWRQFCFEILIRFISKLLYNTPNEKPHTTKLIPEWKRLLYIVDPNLDEEFNESLIDHVLRLTPDQPPPQDKLSLAKHAILCIGAKRDTNKWPLANFAEIAKFLEERYGLEVLVLGLPKDRYFDGYSLSGCYDSLIGNTSLHAAYELCRSASLVISNDSGLAHLAALSGAPTIVLFSGRDKFGKWIPFGNQVLVTQGIASCSPCMLENCSAGYACMKSISIDHVKDLCTRALGPSAS